jgi:rubrerythrin
METDNYEVISFANIDDGDFVGMWGGKTYPVKAREIKMYPKFLADHFAKQLAVKMCIKTGKSWDNESPELAAFIGKILSPLVEKTVSPVAVVEEVAEEEFPEIKEVNEPKEHIDNELYVCSECGKSAANKAGLMAHMRSHK